MYLKHDTAWSRTSHPSSVAVVKKFDAELQIKIHHIVILVFLSIINPVEEPQTGWDNQKVLQDGCIVGFGLLVMAFVDNKKYIDWC